MRTFIIFLITFTVASSFAQTTISQKYESSNTVTIPKLKDTAFRVINTKNTVPPLQAAFFLNGKFVGTQYPLAPALIEEIHVVKQDTLIGIKTYTGQIYLKTKIIKAEHDNYFVDENTLLSVIVDNLDDIEIGIIKLLTKTEKNIKDRNNFILRGEKLVQNKKTSEV
ncbi:hypothetical protein ORI89_10165 [Sphingobacterium sp. UT-1RO-CII-1]|uniref:hypothetical protein n=1 Tax=Sphingobacterium sp. UT-1RO-CII-1 TaxID=2995225 RepID=UPI00227B25C0|nr:hypothetical protein [Sphingobacterium sp. UT-1RO-CII-1]MCY4780015.1 hypothetical protein [Sphingobacterium sp. UT-1RO-CII-1]